MIKPLINYIYNNLLNRETKQLAKAQYYKLLKFVSGAILSYGPDDLKKSLRSLGISSGDTIMVHSSFDFFNGFKGKPQDLIQCFIEIIGDQGNILMVAMPYRTSSLHHLQKNPVFDVNRTISKMGIISEIFRRKKNVLRSLNPIHPVLAYGKDASYIVESHDKCLHSCGEGSPFHKFRLLNGKVLFFDVPFSTFTFIHHIEDLIKDRLPFPMYHEKPFAARVIDYLGNEREVPSYVFGEQAFTTRKPGILENELKKKKLLKKKRIGNTTLMLVAAEDAVRCTYELLDKGVVFYNMEDRRI
ncbi:MAG TPA: AAC(3) family N-acetyltransferase [Syntrophorhabdus sp.]|nr:AAC(3) family N-acetyltransferase [Syntrophorhabdus sp.]